MSRGKLKHQVREQVLPRDITFMSHWWLRYIMTAKQVNVSFLIGQFVDCVTPGGLFRTFFCISDEVDHRIGVQSKITIIGLC